jgi:hypothetical protein
MFGWLRTLWKEKTLESFDATTTRERLVQGGRIVVIDDEKPLLIDELRRAGFSVDHDQSGSDLHNYDAQIYDVAVVDYHGVGQKLGAAQGLDLLKYIKRVSARTRLIAYTSRSLSSTESEFFRQSHIVLPKDMGLGDSLALIESELQKAFSKQHLFEALIARLNMYEGAEQARLQKELVKALSNRDEGQFKQYLSKAVGHAAEKTVEIIISKLF